MTLLAALPQAEMLHNRQQFLPIHTLHSTLYLQSTLITKTYTRQLTQDGDGRGLAVQFRRRLRDQLPLRDYW